jgi:hypothetical protein
MARVRELRFLSICLTVPLIAGVLSGCGGKKGPAKPKVYYVTGKLTMDGQPFGPIILLLHSTNATHSGPLIRGDSDDKGKLKFSTNKLGDGAPEGEYKVSFPANPLGVEAKTVPEVYQTHQLSPLTVKIEPKRKNEITIALDSKAETPTAKAEREAIEAYKKKFPHWKPKEKPKVEKPDRPKIDPKKLR